MDENLEMKTLNPESEIQNPKSPPPSEMGRRVFLKRAALMGGAVGLAAAGIGGKVALDSQGRRALLAERERQRPTGGIAWATQAEYVLLGALASHLLPSDNTGRGRYSGTACRKSSRGSPRLTRGSGQCWCLFQTSRA